MEIMLSELNDCVPSSDNVEQRVEAMQLGEYISEWLDSLPEEDQALFVHRYWFGVAVQELAHQCALRQQRWPKECCVCERALGLFWKGKGSQYEERNDL